MCAFRACGQGRLFGEIAVSVQTFVKQEMDVRVI
jgi:hypothetical protein